MIRDFTGIAGFVCLVAAGVLVALPLGLFIAGVGLLGGAVISALPAPKARGGDNDGPN